MGVTAAIRERPILFSGEMVRAIREGRKTQTRRIVKPQPSLNAISLYHNGDIIAADIEDDETGAIVGYGFDDDERRWPCPYGRPGDRLWVKETHRFPKGLDGMSASEIAASALDANYRKPWAPTRYDSDGAVRCRSLVADFGRGWGKTRVSIHMPRWASRILLEIESVRVEQLQSISDADAMAEGIAAWTSPEQTFSPTVRYHELWESINGPGSWDANPWVWVIEFRVLDGLA